MDVWLDRLDRLLTILRPKAYNVIAKTVIALGVALVVESQTNIVQAIVVALYESLFGYSEFLRGLIGGSTNPWVGIFLIVSGLVYHYLVTIGKEQIELRLSQAPKIPDFDLQILNADLQAYDNNIINLRGSIAIVPDDKEIPDFELNYNVPNMEGISNVLNALGNMERNSAYYKKRAELLKIWGGSELITLKLTNNSENLVSGVEVEARLPRIKGVNADNTQIDFPVLPSKETINRFGTLAPIVPHTPVHYDVKSDHTDNEYCFIWSVGHIQANTSRTSDVYIFLRSEISIDLELTICCDQLPAPITEVYRVEIFGDPINVSIDDLKSSKKEFDHLVSKCVMDGYIHRKAKKKLERYEHEYNELLPRS